MISVDEAVERISRGFAPLAPETVTVADALGRVLATDAVARMDQPPAPMSAMDGYAVRASDATTGAELSLVGEAPAGRPFQGRVGAGQAVRIFTGGVVPEGADSVVIQEDTQSAGTRVVIKEAPRLGENVRPRALDFRNGDVLLPRGHRISARDLALIAGGDLPVVSVTRKPRVALVSTGDELFRPGEPRRDGGIVASSIYALHAMVRQWGGEASDVGILPDRPEAFAALPEATKTADLIVTQGGASVGDHDLVQSALKPHGFALDFWRIAMRPGKPLIFGRLRDTPFIGLPGNPVSAMVCAVLFIRPAIAAMLGMACEPPLAKARLASPLRANGRRQDYIRTRLIRKDGMLTAEPFALQDSSMQKIFAQSDGLIVRPIDAPAANAGDEVEILLLDGC
ncbi:MAG TPA: gephyrin-like molybdotransferase Glp [Micropepsaceae bacterium]|jgi:molybdopterin molybdotransferase|nr:gephyrin-like molybdotransferase Glp [Micropepsaceae bacterium]